MPCRRRWSIAGRMDLLERQLMTLMAAAPKADVLTVEHSDGTTSTIKRGVA